MDEVRCQISHDIVTEVITLSHWQRVPAQRASIIVVFIATESSVVVVVVVYAVSED